MLLAMNFWKHVSYIQFFFNWLYKFPVCLYYCSDLPALYYIFEIKENWNSSSLKWMLQNQHLVWILSFLVHVLLHWMRLIKLPLVVMWLLLHFGCGIDHENPTLPIGSQEKRFYSVSFKFDFCQCLLLHDMVHGFLKYCFLVGPLV